MKRRYDIIQEALSNNLDHDRYDVISEVQKFNPYHDSRGRFTSSSGAASVSHPATMAGGHTGSPANASGGAPTTSNSDFKPASTMQEARDYAKNELGFSGYVDYSYWYIDKGMPVSGELDLDTVNRINQTIADIQKRYPELKGYVQNLECTDKNVYAEVVHSGRDASCSLTIGAKAYKDGVQPVYDDWQQDVDLGYHPQGTTGDAVLWHEYGHAYAAIENKKISGSSTRDQMDAIRNNTAESGWKDEAAQKLGADSSSYGNNISKYATKNDAELFAEAFAAHNTGNGTQWTQAVMEAAGADRSD